VTGAGLADVLIEMKSKEKHRGNKEMLSFTGYRSCENKVYKH